MEVTRYNDPSLLWETIQPQLLAHEAANNLFVGLIKNFVDHPELQSEEHLWFSIADKAGIQLAGWCTPPYPFGLWSPQIETTEALTCLLDFLEKEQLTIPGAIGKPSLVESFTALAVPRFKLENYFTMNQGIYECRQVNPDCLGRGKLRSVTMDELELLTDWMMGFHMESLNQEPLRSEAREQMKHGIEKGSYYFYEEDGQVLSTAATMRAMVKGTSVNMVYTPPEYRKKGYATKSVALLTQKLLDDGWEYAALFTDLDNPTSNSIYQKIGYRKVGESKHVQLKPIPRS